jgi:hypothetical protein
MLLFGGPPVVVAVVFPVGAGLYALAKAISTSGHRENKEFVFERQIDVRCSTASPSPPLRGRGRKYKKGQKERNMIRQQTSDMHIHK